MKNLYFKKHIYLFLICLILKFSFTIQFYYQYKMEVPINSEELDILYINDIADICNKWIPSLFIPILLVNPEIKTGGWLEYLEIIIPSISKYELSILIAYSNITTIFNSYKVFFGKFRFKIIKYCYFGLLNKIGSFKILKENQLLLSNLKGYQENFQRIFSFDKWNIYNNIINTNFYLGDSHENFKLNKNNGIIGSCKNNKNNTFWGCLFNQISFNNSIIDLKTENNTLYNIYFSSENYNIIFPKSFEKKFNQLTNNQCKYNNSDYVENKNLFCENFFNENNYALIKLINDDMNITLEIDNINRFSTIIDENKTETRIIYEDFNYFIFPLIMFKKFHVQFDAENDIISFYTNDASILQVKKEKEIEKEKENNGFIFLLIFIIIIILGIGYGIFWFIRKIKRKRNKLDKIDYTLII